MRRLLCYMKGYGKECILGPFFKLLEASFELMVPLVMAAIIDVGIVEGDRGYIWKMSGVLLGLAAVGLTASVTAQYFAAKAATGFAARVRRELFNHIERLSFASQDKIGTSTLITRMTSDINQVQNGVNLVLRLFLRSPFVVFGAMIMAFTVDVKAAMIFVVTIPLLSVVIFGIMVITMPMFKRLQHGLDQILGRTRENLTGVRVIRAFGKEEDEKQQFKADNQYLTAVQVQVGRISGLTNPLTYIIINAAALAVIGTGADRVFAGDLTQGQVIALVNYMGQILVELVKLANLIITVTKALACANRVADVLEMKTGMKPWAEGEGKNHTSAEQSECEVRFDHVSMAYHEGADPALADLTFTAKSGQTIGIIGGTGSGKSTLVHLIPRFYDVTAGAVYVDGRDVRSYPLDELRAKVGIVMQKAVLFSGTIEENLRWGNKNADDGQLQRAVEMAQAVDVIKGKEEGMAYEIGEGGKNLSGGQKQRLTIARALVKDPRILILDDSSSALDFATDAALRKALNTVQNKIVFMVSQRTSSIRHADQIIVLDDGEVAGIGTHEQLLAECPTYREIHESQTS